MAYQNIRDRRLPFVLRYAADLVTFRHLCWNLVGSDLRARFRRSRLGILWAIIQPLAFSLLIAAVWGSVFRVTDYWGYALYVFSGMIIWEFFNTSLSVSQDSLVNAEGYLKQTRVPFFVFQLRTPLSGFVILMCGFIGFLVLGLALQKLPAPGLCYLFAPAFFGLFLLFCIPLATLMSVVGAQFRDTKYITMIATQALFFISPVMLDRAVLARPELQILNFINPIVPILDLFRGPMLDGKTWPQMEKGMQDLAVVGVWTAALWLAALVTQIRVGRRLIFAL